jgi:hypothetical protein
VRFRLEKLRQATFDELAALPPWSGEEVRFGESLGDLTIYREKESDGRLRIVVQFMPKGMARSLIWRGVHAEGFWIWPNGDKEVLPDALRFGYM